MGTEKGGGKNNVLRVVTDPWGVEAKRRILKRRIWQKAFVCSGDEQSSCQECEGYENCFGGSGRAIKSKIWQTNVTRVQSLIHVRCSHGLLDVKVRYAAPVRGVLRAFW